MKQLGNVIHVIAEQYLIAYPLTNVMPLAMLEISISANGQLIHNVSGMIREH